MTARTWAPSAPLPVSIPLHTAFPCKQSTDNSPEGVENSGVYEWVPEKELPGGDDYAIQIVSEDDEINYTSLLSIKSDVKAKPVSESASPSASASEEAPKSTHHDASKTMTTDAPHHTTMASNGTIVTSTKPYSNSTATSTKKSSSARPSSTSSAEESSVPSTPADSGAIGVVRSPLALVACLVGAIVYFN